MGLTFRAKPRHHGRRVFIALVILILVAAGALYLLVHRPGPPALPKSEVDAYLKAWGTGDARTMESLLDKAPADLATNATSLVKSAPGSHATYTRTTLVRDNKSDNKATATYSAHVDVAGFGPVDWKGTLLINRVKQAGGWQWEIHWDPTNLYPDLRPGQHLTFTRTFLTRAPIIASDGSFLAGSQAIVKIGLEPDRITKSLPKIKQLMQSLVGTQPSAIDAALHGPGVQPNYFVEIAQVPDDARYANELRPKLAPIAGVFFQHALGVVTPAGLVSADLIGRVGEITAERLKQLGAPYRVGDIVGLGGLQSAFETRLAGRPSGNVEIDAGTRIVKTVKHFPGLAPQPVTVTLDPKIQQAANTALAGVTLPAGLVAVDTQTGEIRAVVSKPDNGFQRALDGAYPPGSTFKVITSTALLAAGRTGSTAAPCPPTLTVDGKNFTNFEGESGGALDLAGAFKISCNNAFIGLADQLPNDALSKAASRYGFNVHYRLPVASYGGTFPTPSDRAELAASAIGQGRILASPMQMASVAAAVASGQWHAPSITTQPAPTNVTAKGLDPDVETQLRAFMASVIQPGGTAAGAGLPPDVFSKTGTAEFGHANPPQTHAWFIGYEGNLAFAVIVEGGGVGGRVAAPLAANFLHALANG